MSDAVADGKDKKEANERFSLAFNTICLVAQQDVVTALMNFHYEIRYSNPNKSPERHDVSDNKDTFLFHLMGSAPK